LFDIGVASFCGANLVFAIDINDFRLNIAKKMGDNIIPLNPLKDNIIEIIKDKTDGYGIDVVIELSGSPQAIKTDFKALRKGGRVSLIGLYSQEVLLDLVNDVIYKEATVYGITGREMFNSWYLTEKIINSGKINIKAVLTHEFPLEETEKAILLVKEGKCGKVIIKI
jgi:threonine 3-dehydrogenase